MLVFIVIICIAILAVLIENFREITHFKITHYQIDSQKFPPSFKGKRILFLSDLHNRVYGRNNEKLIGALRMENPDMVLIGGDMLVSRKGHSFEPALHLIKELTKLCPVYCANGNHELRLKERPEDYGSMYEDYRRRLLKSGAHILENDAVTTDFDGFPVCITGYDLPLRFYKRLRSASIGSCRLYPAVEKCDPLKYQILLAHNPCFMKAYKEWGADLVLSGHLHGGIVRIPGKGGVIAPDFKMFPQYSGGLYRDGDTDFVVSRGLGTHTIPLRLFNMPEAVSIEIRGKEGGEH